MDGYRYYTKQVCAYMQRAVQSDIQEKISNLHYCCIARYYKSGLNKS